MKFEDLLINILNKVDDNGFNKVIMINLDATGAKLEDVKEAVQMAETVIAAERKEYEIKASLFHLTGCDYGIAFVDSGSVELIA